MFIIGLGFPFAIAFQLNNRGYAFFDYPSP